MNNFFLNNPQVDTPRRRMIRTGLMVVGFIALISAGLGFAVYATRFVPTAVNGLGSAAVSLGSLFTSEPEPESDDRSIVPPPSASTTISLGATPSTPPAPATRSQAITPVSGSRTNNAYQIGTGVPQSRPFSGLADLTVEIQTTGYLTTASADSFIASSTVPVSGRPAVRFIIRNVGTNTTGSWRFNASIPIRNGFFFQSQLQQSLLPGESVEYTLGFDQSNRGGRQTIAITANPDHLVTESNTNNNTASATVTVL